MVDTIWGSKTHRIQEVGGNETISWCTAEISLSILRVVTGPFK